MASRARIYRRPKTAMQSGKAGTHEWLLDFEPADARRAVSADGLDRQRGHPDPRCGCASTHARRPSPMPRRPTLSSRWNCRASATPSRKPMPIISSSAGARTGRTDRAPARRAPLARWIEQQPSKLWVPGSSPGGRAMSSMIWISFLPFQRLPSQALRPSAKSRPRVRNGSAPVLSHDRARRPKASVGV